MPKEKDWLKTPPTDVPPAHRLISVDFLRGAVMVLMALDHTRGFFSNADMSPTDLDKTSVALFLTRWITHFCAPVFIFLAGASAFLYSRHAPNKWHLSRFLITRGIWILLLGVFGESLIWSFTADFSVISGAVLWAIGWSMLVLAVLVFFPLPLIAAFGVAMIIGHNLFDGIGVEGMGALGPAWSILHTGDTVQLTNGLALRPYYPLIPWIGVMAAGYGFGRLLLLEQARQKRVLFSLGSLMLGLFVLLRYSNSYGDPTPWVTQGSGTFTLLSFLNCEKYPPSLLYLLMTLGPAIMILPWLNQISNPLARFFVTFGRVPLFYYLLHLPFLLLLYLIVLGVTGGSISGVIEDPYAKGFGYGLPVVYLIWMGVVMALYPVCYRFSQVKAKHRNLSWLRYL